MQSFSLKRHDLCRKLFDLFYFFFFSLDISYKRKFIIPGQILQFIILRLITLKLCLKS